MIDEDEHSHQEHCENLCELINQEINKHFIEDFIEGMERAKEIIINYFTIQ